MDQFIDRRNQNTRGLAINRQKLIDRVSEEILNFLVENLNAVNINDETCKIKLSLKALLEEPRIRYDSKDGVYDYTLMKNNSYRVGDKLKKREESDGMFGGGTNDGTDEDYNFNITPEELEKIMLDDLVLPNLLDKSHTQTETTIHRGGFTKTGNPCKLDIKKSYKESLMRRNALEKQKELELAELEKDPELNAEQISLLKEKTFPLFAQNDMRYKSSYTEEKPITSAVLYLMMDVSGSMDDEKKALARIGCFVLKLLLKRSYKNLEIVFIRHHIEASICTERKFFKSHSDGGTQISSALEMMYVSIKNDYPPDKYNIYALQLTDGENSSYDNRIVIEMLGELLSYLQLYAFIAIRANHAWAQELSSLIQKHYEDRPNVVVFPINFTHDWKKFFKRTFTHE